jgi:hypothetical protein
MVLRLRAAAHALFPPEGEEEKSEVEAERHLPSRVPTAGHIHQIGRSQRRFSPRDPEGYRATVWPAKKPSLATISATTSAGTGVTVVTAIAASRPSPWGSSSG